MRRFAIADTHFRHPNIIGYCNRPENYEELIIRHWKEDVEPDDIVYHFGDVIFYDKPELYSIMSQLPGKKILIKGNHDSESDSFYYKNGFDYVCEGTVVNKILFTHRAVPDVPEFYEWNFHGHNHNRAPEHYTLRNGFLTGGKNVLISVEFTNYHPIQIDRILNALRAS
jgi:calcineurin-like phosphoesterase family protein